jgi:hypothetical protein
MSKQPTGITGNPLFDQKMESLPALPDDARRAGAFNRHYIHRQLDLPGHRRRVDAITTGIGGHNARIICVHI